MSIFRVGQKVVCIGDEWGHDDYLDVTFPIVGSVYTIRDIEVDDDDGDVYLRFEEIFNPVHRYRKRCVENSFEAAAFRPVVTRKTDISIFTDMLNTQRTGVPA